MTPTRATKQSAAAPNRPRVASAAVKLAVAGSVIFQHLQLATVGGFPVTVCVLMGVPLMIYLAGLSPRPSVILSVTSLGAYAGIVALASEPFADAWDFFTSLALLLLALTLMGHGANAFSPALLPTLEAILKLVVLFSIAQVVVGAAGSDMLFNPFRDHQYLYQYRPFLAFNPVARAQGFFLEPSYDAFVIGSLSVTILAAGGPILTTVILATLGMAACKSAIGMLLLALILGLLGLRSHVRARLPMLTIVSVFLFAFFPYLVTRMDSIGDSGSSGNYRILAPLDMLADILTRHPLGMPLGSIPDVVPKYGLAMAGVERATTLDNGFYVIVYYFGWPGLALLTLAGAWVVHTALRHGHTSSDRSWIAPIWLYASLLFTGAIVAPEFAFMSALTIGAFRSTTTMEWGFKWVHDRS